MESRPAFKVDESRRRAYHTKQNRGFLPQASEMLVPVSALKPTTYEALSVSMLVPGRPREVPRHFPNAARVSGATSAWSRTRRMILENLISLATCPGPMTSGTEQHGASPPLSGGPSPGTSGTANKMLEVEYGIWKTTIETQMHFNDLLIRYRQFSITSLTTVVAAVVVAATHFNFASEHYRFIILMLMAAWASIGILDWTYYRRLLLGAVEYAEERFDQQPQLGGIRYGLSRKISERVGRRLAGLSLLLYYLIPEFLGVWSLMRLA